MNFSPIDVDLRLMQQSQSQIVSENKNVILLVAGTLVLLAGAIAYYQYVEKKKYRELYLK